ncbi:licheninase [Ilyonectria robusta]
MSVHVDFTQGEVNSFAASGSPTYDDNGVSFTVSRSGDAPQLASLFYIMFGRVEITMKAAPGAGIVSSLVLQSDDLDEIDIEWLGASPDEIQSNYFGKGQTTTYNRGQFHDVTGTQSEWITYTVDWTQDRIIWMAGGTAVRTLNYADAENQYPQTPMQVKFGAWSGGDSSNAAGTIKWAEGPTDYTQGPFTMQVQSIQVTDYSTGSEYKYTDTSALRPLGSPSTRCSPDPRAFSSFYVCASPFIRDVCRRTPHMGDPYNSPCPQVHESKVLPPRRGHSLCACVCDMPGSPLP